MLRILPSRERVEEELLEVAWREGVSLGGGALALPEFVALLAPREPVDALAQRAIFEGCARGVDLGPFHAVRGSAGFAAAALEAIAALKAGRCGSKELNALAERAQGPRSGRLEAIARLYAAYERALSERSADDPSDRLARAVARLDDRRAPLPPVLAAAASVSFEDLYDFTPLRLELVLALARRFEAEGRGQRVQLLLPHDPERPELTSFVDSTWEEVYRRAQTTRALDLVPKVYGDAESGPARLARRLFRRTATAWPGPPVARLWSCATADEEWGAVARDVRARLAAGAPPESIAIAVRRLDEGARRLAGALERAGVPTRIRRGAPLLECRTAQLALRLLAARAEGLSREALEALVAGGVGRSGAALAAVRETGLLDDEDGRGPGGWRRALALLGDRRQRLGQSVRGAEWALEALGPVERAIAAVQDRPAPLSSHARGLVAALRALAPAARRADRRCERGGLSVLRRAAAEQAGAARVHRALRALEAAQAVAGRASELCSPEAFAAQFEAALAERFLPPCAEPAAVRIVDVRELIGSRCDHLYLAGMVEGGFPSAPRALELLSFEDLARVNALAGRQVFRIRASPAGPVPEGLAEEVLLFHLAVSTARATVTLSWPRADERGRPTLPSRFVEEVRRVEGAFVAEARKRAVLARGVEAATWAELAPRAALEHLAPAASRVSAPDRSFDPAGTWEELRSVAPGRVRSVESRAVAQRERDAFFAAPEAEPGPFTGGAQALAPALEEALAFDAQRPLSPRTLALLGNCRFQGFAALILRLRAPPESGAQADSAALGELYHGALQRFFSERKARGLLPLRGDTADLVALEGALASAAASLERERPTGHPGLWSIALEEALDLLARVVRREAEAPLFPGLLPERFEVELGGAELPLLTFEGVPGEAPLFVGGRIDRIDSGSGRAAAVDYKSGRTASLVRRFRETFLRSEFQLAIYAAALQRARAQRSDAALVSLRDAEVVRLSEILRAMELDPDEVLPPLPDAAPERPPAATTLSGAVWEVVRDARRGRFGARPVGCGFCTLSPLCRIDRFAAEGGRR
jgi:hypothetical protein